MVVVVVVRHQNNRGDGCRTMLLTMFVNIVGIDGVTSR